MAANITGHGRDVFRDMTQKHGIRFQSFEGVKPEEYVKQVAEITGPENVIAASRANGAVVVFVNSVSWVGTVCSIGIDIDGCWAHVEPLVKPCTKLILSGVPPYIPQAILEGAITQYGKIVSPMKPIPLGCKLERLRHVKSFRRQVHIIPHEGIESQDLQGMFHVSLEGRTYRIYLSTDEPRCFKCNMVGHFQRQCPNTNNDTRQDNIENNETQTNNNDETNVNTTQRTPERQNANEDTGKDTPDNTTIHMDDETDNTTDDVPIDETDNSASTKTKEKITTIQIERENDTQQMNETDTVGTDNIQTEIKDNDIQQNDSNTTPKLPNTKSNNVDSNEEERVRTPPSPSSSAPSIPSDIASSSSSATPPISIDLSGRLLQSGEASNDQDYNSYSQDLFIVPETQMSQTEPNFNYVNEDTNEDEIESISSEMSDVSLLNESQQGPSTDSIREFLSETMHSKKIIEKCKQFCPNLKILTHAFKHYRSTQALTTSQKARIHKIRTKVLHYIKTTGYKTKNN